MQAQVRLSLRCWQRVILDFDNAIVARLETEFLESQAREAGMLTVAYSSRSCRQICLRSNRSPEDHSGAVGRTSTVSF